MIETKTELEETVKVHKESVQKQRVVESKIEVIHLKFVFINASMVPKLTVCRVSAQNWTMPITCSPLCLSRDTSGKRRSRPQGGELTPCLDMQSFARLQSVTSLESRLTTTVTYSPPGWAIAMVASLWDTCLRIWEEYSLPRYSVHMHTVEKYVLLLYLYHRVIRFTLDNSKLYEFKRISKLLLICPRKPSDLTGSKRVYFLTKPCWNDACLLDCTVKLGSLAGPWYLTLTDTSKTTSLP